MIEPIIITVQNRNLEDLSEQQQIILQYLGQGYSTEEIAEEMEISEEDALTAIEAVKQILDIYNMVELALFCVKKGLIIIQ